MQTTTEEKKVRFGFITKRPFWVNLLATGALAFLILFIFLQMLSWMTNHGKFLTVPSVVGMKTDEAIKLLETKGFDVNIQDSTYTDTAARGTVLKQLPDPNATVKVNRTVFLVVNRFTLPMIDMPKLEGQSLNFALDMLARTHLKLADTLYRASFMAGVVLEQQLNGVRIPEKTKVQWGSKITLVIGAGLGDEQMLVPGLVGMSFNEAKEILSSNGIELGAVMSYNNMTITDTSSAYVVKQSPERFNDEHLPIYIKSGQIMDLTISQQMVELKTDSTTSIKKDKMKNE
jgi:beta-lactam-binding protein with PASTA domain